MRFKTSFIYFFICFALSANAQSKVVLSLFEDGKKTTVRLNDTTKIQKEVDKVIQYHLNKGYLEVRLDSLIKENGVANAYLYIGARYKWASFSLAADTDVSFLKRNFINLEQDNINIDRFVELRKRSVKAANNEGYPYAKFFLTNLSTVKDSLRATIDFQLGTKVFFDALDVEENLLKKKFLAAYLNVRAGSSFSKNVIDEIPYLINKLKGVSLDGPVNIEFYKDVCKVSLKLKKEPDDDVDALIGFQTNVQKKPEVIGGVKLSLNNLFKSSKKIDLNWQKPTELNQQLNVSLDYPNVFLSNFGAVGRLDFLKRDTSFLNVAYKGGLYYQLSKQIIGFNVTRKVSSLFNENYQSDSLASFKSINTSLTYELDKMKGDYLKSRGFKYVMSVGVEQVNFKDSSRVVPSSRFKSDFVLNVPLSSFMTIHQQIKGMALFSETILVNQMEQIGGYNSIRGFNQNQFFVERYFMGSTAFVFHVANQANISLFSDFGLLLTSYGQEEVVSGGLELILKSNNTFLKFAYALGQTSSQNFSLALSKVHVGITTNF